MQDDFEEKVKEFVSPNDVKKHRSRKPRRSPLGLWTKVFILLLAVVAVAAAALAAVVLFTQTPTYSSAALLTSGCASPTGTATGTVVAFACGSSASIYVTAGLSGTVSYTAFTQPTNVTDVYLIDAAAPAGASCSAYTSGGNEPVAMSFAGGSVTVTSTAGNLKPGHAYDYCMDYSAAPPSFSFTVTWSQ